MKKLIYIGIICGLIFGVSLGVGLKLGFMQTNAERYAETWKIELPQGMTKFIRHIPEIWRSATVCGTRFLRRKA